MKKIRIFLAVLMLIVFLCAILPAEEQSAYTQNPNSLGFFVGETSGTGLHYQRWLGKFGIQAAFGLLYSPGDDFYGYSIYPWEYEEYIWVEESTGKTYTTYYRKSLQYAAGIEALYRIYTNDFANWFSGCLYLFGGVNHGGEMKYYYAPRKEYYTDGGTDYYWTEDFTRKVKLGFIPHLNIGIGIGMEPLFFKHFSIPLEIGYYVRWKNFTFTEESFLAGFMFQGGLRYRF